MSCIFLILVDPFHVSRAPYLSMKMLMVSVMLLVSVMLMVSMVSMMPVMFAMRLGVIGSNHGKESIK